MMRAVLAAWALLAGQEADPSLVPRKNLERLGAAGSPVRKGEVLAFFGDSITMQGEDPGRKGYLTLLRKALESGEGTRDRGARVLGFGLNGGRVPTMLEGCSPWGKIRDSAGKPGTFQDMLDREKPTVAVIALGINDVWHREKGTPPREFEAGLARMLDLAAKAGALPVLCTPTIIGSKPPGTNEFDEKLDEYSDIVRRLGAARKIAVADNRGAFQDFIRRHNKEGIDSGFLTYDQVHMNAAGNALLAEGMAGAVLEALKASGGKAVLPRLGVSDRPAYPYRGLLVDLARKYHTPGGVKQVIELCRFYKIRYLHLHLSDDQLFMFRSAKFPQLGKGNREFARFEPPSGPRVEPCTIEEPVAVTLSPRRPGLTLKYTLDNSVPNRGWKVYSGPIRLEQTVHLRAGLFDASDALQGYMAGAWFRRQIAVKPNLATRKPVTVGPGPDRADAWGAKAAVDGRADDVNAHWASKDPAPQWLQIDLEKACPVDSVTVVTYYDGGRLLGDVPPDGGPIRADRHEEEQRERLGAHRGGDRPRGEMNASRRAP